jgi:SAM-dependent MidA family methyltransferase
VPFIIAHEFFDALPIHAFQSVAAPQPETIMTPTGPAPLRKPLAASGTQWRELVVSINPEPQAGTNDKGPEFRLSLAKSSTPASMLMPEMSPRYKALKGTRGSTIEISPESHQYVQEFAQRIGGAPSESQRQGNAIPTGKAPRKPAGAALILDYGPLSTIPVNSLRGIQNHKLVSPFSSPGLVDLSADVDFTALAEAAVRSSPGVEVYGPIEQGSFLQSLGIAERAAQLLRRVEDETKRQGIESGWKRLVERGGGGMGRIYKAMAIVPDSGGSRRPVGFGGDVNM